MYINSKSVMRDRLFDTLRETLFYKPGCQHVINPGLNRWTESLDYANAAV